MKATYSFLIAIALAAAVIVSAVYVQPQQCSARLPHWFNVLFFTAGPLSAAAIFAAILAYGWKWNVVGRTFAAIGGAAVWAFGGLFILIEILLPPGCLS